jgi:short-subunit dehydrogenase
MDPAGAVVLVTGASSGIGRATAGLLAGRGARLLLSGRDEAALKDVATSTGGTALPADLTGPGAAGELARRAVAVHGRVDVLVASAGIGWAGEFATQPEESILELVQVNLSVPMELCRALLPAMLERKQGSVVLVGSIAGLTGVAGESVYAATKAGLSLFTESLALEIAGRGVGVSCVVPGVVDTAFFQRRGVPYGRTRPKLLPPERLAQAVVNCIETHRVEVVVPAWLNLPTRVRALSPGMYRLLARRFGNN